MDGLCIRSWDFERLQSWPPECTAVGCTLVDKKLKLVPRNAQITFDISLDRPLSDRTLVIELTLPNIAPGKLFEASLEAEEEMNYESLVLGKPNRSWSFVRREASRDGAPRETSLKLSTIYETGAAERHTMCLVVNVGNGHVSCLRDGVQLKAPTGVAQLASVGAGNDMQITLRNFGGESVVIHKVELWASASLTAVPTSSLTPPTTLAAHEALGPSAPSTPTDPGKYPVGVANLLDKKDWTPPPIPVDEGSVLSPPGSSLHTSSDLPLPLQEAAVTLGSDPDAGGPSQSADQDDKAAANATTSAGKTLQLGGRRSRAGLPAVNLLLEGLEDVPENDENLLLAEAFYMRPESAVRGTIPLTQKEKSLPNMLLEGMVFNAYYPDSKDAAALEKSLRNALASFWPDPLGFRLDVVPVASSLVYLEVIGDSGRTIGELMDTLRIAEQGCANLKSIVEYNDDIFELQRVGDEWWPLFLYPRPVINFVLFAAVKPERANGSVRELVIVRGKNFRGDLKLKWRKRRDGDPLKECELMSTEALKELGIVYLTSSPESLAVAFGTSATNLAGEQVSIQWVRNSGEFGGPLLFKVPVLPLPRTEGAVKTFTVAYDASSDRPVPASHLPPRSQALQPSSTQEGDRLAVSPGPVDQPQVQPASQGGFLSGPPAAFHLAANPVVPRPTVTASASEEHRGVERRPEPSPRSVLPASPLPTSEEESDRRWRTGRWKYVVFISHAGEDKTFAHRLHEEFKRIGLSAFLDQANDGLVPGDQADPLMLKAVKEAPVGLALLSKHFPRKEWPIRELQIIVEQETLLPVLYKIAYEEAKSLLRTSPQAQGISPEQWKSFTKSVLRTTYEKNPVASSDEGPFVQAIVYSAVRICVKVAHKVADASSNRVWAYKFVCQVKEAARTMSKEYRMLRVEQKDKAKRWANEMEILAESKFDNNE